MIPDIRFEADFLRAALLLLLVHERDIIDWADALLVNDSKSVALLTDIALAQPDLSSLREALRPLAEPAEPTAVGAALLSFLATDPGAGALIVSDRIRILTQIRHERIVAESICDDIKSFEDRWLLASAGVIADQQLGADMDRWLDTVRRPGYYRISVGHEGELAALLGALSRKVVRNRLSQQSAESGSRAWILESTPGIGPALVVNEALWKIAIAEFSPLPIAGRIPYGQLPTQAVQVLDESTAEAMGALDARNYLATV